MTARCVRISGHGRAALEPELSADVLSHSSLPPDRSGQSTRELPTSSCSQLVRDRCPCLRRGSLADPFVNSHRQVLDQAVLVVGVGLLSRKVIVVPRCSRVVDVSDPVHLGARTASPRSLPLPLELLIRAKHGEYQIVRSLIFTRGDFVNAAWSTGRWSILFCVISAVWNSECSGTASASQIEADRELPPSGYSLPAHSAVLALRVARHGAELQFQLG